MRSADGREPITGAVRVVAVGLRSPEGPVVLPDGSVAVVESMASRVSRVTADGSVHPIAVTGDGPNGMALDPDGHLVVANNGGIGHTVTHRGRLQRIDEGVVQDLAEELDAPNDVCASSDGALWFTDPRDNWYADELRPGRVYRWAAGELTIVHEGFEYPNGIGWMPDGALLVAESRTGALHRRDAGGWRVWSRMPNGAPDGFAFDADGRCYVCCFDSAEIVVVEPDGRVGGVIELESSAMPTNCAISPTGDLYVTESAGGRLLALPLGLRPAALIGPG